jgi:hypothetical protein
MSVKMMVSSLFAVCSQRGYDASLRSQEQNKRERFCNRSTVKTLNTLKLNFERSDDWSSIFDILDGKAEFGHPAT